MGVAVCVACMGEGEGTAGVVVALGEGVGECSGVIPIASVSLASTVWYAWVTFRVGVVVPRAGKLHPARLAAQMTRIKKEKYCHF